MSLSFEANLRHTLFIVKESNSLRKLGLPAEWHSVLVTSQDQILSCVERAHKQSMRMVVIVSEEDYERTYQLLKLRMQREKPVVYGIVVISQKPYEFLSRGELTSDFLDVVSEKDIKKNFNFILMRCVRYLVLSESKGLQKIGPETLEKLNRIFIDLSSERNPEKLLTTILEKAITLTQAEGGALFMVEETDGEMYFRLKVYSLNGKPPVTQAISYRVMENSINGFVALTGKLLNVPDISAMRSTAQPQYNRNVDFDGLKENSCMLTVPLKNSRNECVAVLQLVNKKDEKDSTGKENVPFEQEDESLLSSFGTQAATCLENVDLYADIQRLFEGFVKASITAIESRDPSTGGHSERVAKMCVALARATTECETGIYRSVKFKEEEVRELEYAAMLHDFGKIGVREEVLVKAKKLYPHQLEAIQERIKICKAAAKIDFLERKLKQASHPDDLEREYVDRVNQLHSYWEMVLAANEPAILKQENIEILEKIRNEQLLLPDSSHIALLSEEEYKALSVTKGSLTDSERLEIESHVRHTYQFLKMIPWTKDFKHLTEIAYCHHEKLDGTGYPRGLTSHEIPLQSKIMTISDIFDALTAADRWYKEAVPTDRAIEILGHEVSEGKLDPVLFELFVEKRIFEIAHPKLLNQVA